MPIIYTENGVIKSPKHPRYIYTKNEVDEIKKCSKSLVYFAERYIINQKLSSKQKEILEAYQNEQFVILKYTKNFDNGALTVLTGLWYSLFNFKDDNLVIVLSDTRDKALYLAKRFKSLYENLPSFFKLGVKEYNEYSIEFENNSKIYFRKLGPCVMCGESPNLVIIDEYSEQKDLYDREFFISNYPSISALNDKMFLCSSGTSPSKIFNEVWEDSPNNIYRCGYNFKHLEITEEGK